MVFEKYIRSEVSQKVEDIFLFIRRKISIKNIIFFILTMLFTNQTFLDEKSLFSYVMFGIASVFNVPLILILIASTISLLIEGISATIFIKMLAFFAVFTLITAILNIEGISRKYSVFIKFIISYISVDLVSNFITSEMITNLFSNLSNILILSILYFVFVSGIYVILNISKKYVFSREETVSMVILLSLSLTAFSGINVFGFNIVNILVFSLILVYGWKNGAINASCAGLIVGLFLTCMLDKPISYVIILAFSGLVSGIFKKFGKVAVVISFIFGNIVLSYYMDSFEIITTYFTEMLISSIVLLFLPKNIESKIDNIFNKNKTLMEPYKNILDTASVAKEKIGTISELFDSISGYEIENTKEDIEETREVIKKYIINAIDDSCIDCKNRNKCCNKESLDITVDYIANKLENNEEIKKEMLFDCEKSENMINDIKEIYMSMQLTRIIKQKEKENSKKVSNQYKEMSKILKNISKSIRNDNKIIDNSQIKLRDELKFYGYIVYEDELKREFGCVQYTFVTDILTNIEKQKKEILAIASDILEQNVMIKLILNSSKNEKSKIKIVTKPDYEIKNYIFNEKKSGEDVSGDSFYTAELQDMKQLSVISDGVGSGKQASKSSNLVINMLEKLLSGGFDEKKAVEIINSVIKLKGQEDIFSTLDTFIFDLRTGEAQFIKLGSAPTYIVQNGKIVTVNNTNIPLGLLKDADYIPLIRQLHDNDIVIQVSDGIVKEGSNPTNNYLTKYLQSIDMTKSLNIIAEDIYRLLLKENNNVLDDDVTIIISRIIHDNDR